LIILHFGHIFLLLIGLENFPQISQIFQFFYLLVKKSSGQVKKYLGRSWLDHLFTAGQKYAWVEMGQRPSFVGKPLPLQWFLAEKHIVK